MADPGAELTLTGEEGASAIRRALGADGVNLIAAFLHRFDNPRTQRAYRNDLGAFFGDVVVDASTVRRVTFLHVNEYIATLQASGKAPSTVRRKVAAIRGFFDWLDALGLVDENPTKRQLLRKLGRANSSDRAILVLTADQASSLLEAASVHPESGIRDRTLISVLLHCVLRRSEASDMDRAHVRTVGGFSVLDLPKAKGGTDQYVKIPNHVASDIASHCDHYGIEAGPLWRSLSRSSRGNRLTPFSIYRIVRNSARAAGLPDIGAHTLRHTGCTLALEAGASIPQVQSHARHKRAETTMTYLHQRDRLAESAADFIDLKR